MDLDPYKLAEQFVTDYYNTLQNDRKSLVNFFTEDSVLSYNGESHKGLEAIKHQLKSLGYEKIVYSFDTCDVQPSPVSGGILIFCTGTVTIDNESQFKFSQCFQVLPNGSGGFYLHNDILRLVF
eukprot:TRINITY_DN6484_c0_g1_i2.p1 TRINITY_DN6484_c0_g1~~TRINITY_DN6484_c0_g1_i2.p1  ORF type:complete len:124 (+),score=34.37 TRINITY_DN6484_c0_g1_i2:144-515(+)